MNLAAALDALLPLLRDDDLVVHANGFISRVSFAKRPREASFYMIGSMGLASSIGLGLALAQPRRRVIVFDGDGNVLMNLGSLAMAAALRPANYLHVCFDNAAYGSTGRQRTVSASVPLEAMATAAGYAAASRVDTPEALAAVFREWLGLDGPRFLLARIDAAVEEKGLPRVEPEPLELARRFRRAAGGTKA